MTETDSPLIDHMHSGWILYYYTRPEDHPKCRHRCRSPTHPRPRLPLPPPLPTRPARHWHTEPPHPSTRAAEAHTQRSCLSCVHICVGYIGVLYVYVYNVCMHACISEKIYTCTIVHVFVFICLSPSLRLSVCLPPPTSPPLSPSLSQPVSLSDCRACLPGSVSVCVYSNTYAIHRGGGHIHQSYDKRERLTRKAFKVIKSKFPPIALARGLTSDSKPSPCG